ncbi:DUF3082 domain-containing protein [Synechocystis sp. PCC 7509]|uniref:DUF3082 domain-containing protein n=1 Tax=Synechocystis sp. PCC 7509 TaxID=927677 RepID=UPI0002ABF12C|nr:DUF3082 domain-containing protein [Synechocystis sp. PCC 7509]
MNNLPPTEPPTDLKPLPTPLRSSLGAVIASGLAIALYRVTSAISLSFAQKPLHSDNALVVKITIAVRTLVVGLSTLATFIFAIVAFALFALAIQATIQKLKQSPSS